MSVFDSMQISASGLSLERLKLDTISTNIANVNTTRTEEGGPYRNKQVVFEEALREADGPLFNVGRLPLNGPKSFGVRATAIEEDDTQVLEYNPAHPDANADGYVATSNVDMADEMIKMMQTIRTYDANITALEAGKELLKQALTISAK